MLVLSSEIASSSIKGRKVAPVERRGSTIPCPGEGMGKQRGSVHCPEPHTEALDATIQVSAALERPDSLPDSPDKDLARRGSA